MDRSSSGSHRGPSQQSSLRRRHQRQCRPSPGHHHLRLGLSGSRQSAKQQPRRSSCSRARHAAPKQWRGSAGRCRHRRRRHRRHRLHRRRRHRHRRHTPQYSSLLVWLQLPRMSMSSLPVAALQGAATAMAGSAGQRARATTGLPSRPARAGGSESFRSQKRRLCKRRNQSYALPHHHHRRRQSRQPSEWRGATGQETQPITFMGGTDIIIRRLPRHHRHSCRRRHCRSRHHQRSPSSSDSPPGVPKGLRRKRRSRSSAEALLLSSALTCGTHHTSALSRMLST